MLLEKKRTKKEECSRESAREDRDKGKVWRRKKEEKKKRKERDLFTSKRINSISIITTD